MLTKTIKLLSN